MPACALPATSKHLWCVVYAAYVVPVNLRLAREASSVITAFISCVLGILIGHFQVSFIIKAAIPALMFIYPITIVLILLNLCFVVAENIPNSKIYIDRE